MGITVYDIDFDRGTVFIRGKGNKDRVIPIGGRALVWIQKYLAEVRTQLVVEPDDHILFLTAHGEAFSPNHLTGHVREYIHNADIGKRGSCHLFRHAMATLMLENGADIRFIQSMLGHSRLNTTEVYTQVSIRKLKEIHDATHPANKQKKPKKKPLKKTLKKKPKKPPENN
ncbi:MAG: tyrosine-type recombinase/integrase [Chitinivibrionales bacterium]|nr:tyrosine-type recombinase/integrase [Chitinivibrionales bacterium]